MGDQNRPHDEENSQTGDKAAEPELTADELLASIEEAAGQESGENAGETEPVGEGFSNPLEALAAENSRQEEEIAALKDQILRSAAEMENLRRRTQKDVADARAYSVSGFAKDMLAVADNLRRALDHVSDEDKQQKGLATLVEGVEMTERELHNIMEKNGVKKVSPANEKFDPDRHQAMFEVANAEVPNNTVIEVVQVGYVIGDRVLRPALVGVAKGGPKQQASAEPTQDENSEAVSD